MKTLSDYTISIRNLTLFAAINFLCTQIQADPQVTSWYTDESGQYARLFESTATESAGTSVTTWSRGQGVQSQPTYVGVHEISYSTDWLYIRTTGLGSHIMGPWYLNAAKTNDFPNYPANGSVIYRIPRSPVASTGDELTGLGAVGYFVDGVSMFDSRDAFSYDTSAGDDEEPTNSNEGDGVWNREAYVNESVTFDAASAHQAMSQYHYHANPPALRYQLGGHVDYNSGTNVYTEKSGIPSEHSPIIGWVADGYPIYGPYGYSDANSASSAIALMRSGYQKRDITERTTLPAWASRIQKGTSGTGEYTLAASEYGPAVNANYVLGHYIEDYEYLGDLGDVQGTDFDLDEHNGRWCVTPEFPAGTYAYFTCLESDGTPKFPYNIGRSYYGEPTGSTVNDIAETVTISFEGGPELEPKMNNPTVDAGSGDVTLTWSAVEGGVYTVEADNDLTAPWSELSTTTMPTLDFGSFTETDGVSGVDRRFWRVQRTALADFDDAGFVWDGSDTGGETNTTIDLTGTGQLLPPANATPTSVTIGGIAGSNISYDGSIVSADFDLSSLLSGTHAVVVSFPGPTFNLTYTKP